MAILTNNVLTLADYATRLGPDGTLAPLINMVSQNNEVLEDMLWMEGNLPTGHKTTQVVGIPQASWRLLNYGVPYVKGQTASVTDTTAMLEAYTKTDKKLVDLASNPAGFRLGEESIVIQGMSIQMASALFYGNNQANPAMFTGLAPRYSTVNTGTAPNAANVLDAGGTGSDNTSIWLVVWGQNSITGIYPKGSQAGLQHEDVTTNAPVLDAAGNPYQAYQSHYMWDCGISLRDWRYVVRIANISIAALKAGTGPNLIDLMIQAVNLPPVMPSGAGNVQGTAGDGGRAAPVTMGRAAIYCNRTVATWLQIAFRKERTAFTSVETVMGRTITSFEGIPIRKTDALLNTEARVV
ncbi:hypothetical protein M0638_27385 [Roseomonas sp. NAR14]|uniref:Uncharacterized protein n=1 Tax=Roseomonas acroporae TaxID=2937791 RepID=A0A9X2BZL1_9PROT|nr:hypothetical protein [Roseomonas acroporae]MCK8788084.1 hypothetical protein [Roseomonas acroporae]